MISHRQVRVLGWWLCAPMSLVAAFAWWVAIPMDFVAPGQSIPPTPRSARALDTSGLGAATSSLRTRDPFRIERKPARLQFTLSMPIPAAAVRVAVPPPPRPLLAIVGLIGGPPWSVVIDGLPTGPGAVGGETDSGKALRLVRVRGDTVVLAGMDTTWTLVYGRR